MYRLYADAVEYKDHHVQHLEHQRKRLTTIFSIMTIFTFILALAASIITALLISKLIYNSYPDWFFYTTAGISAVTSLITGLLSFFVVKDNISDISKKLNKIEAEEVLYNNKLHAKYRGKKADFAFYTSIATILGSDVAKKEVNNV